MIKTCKFVFLVTFLGISAIENTACSVHQHTDSLNAPSTPFMSLTIPVSSISLTKKTPEKTASFKALTLKGTLAEDASTDDVITRICARVNCDNISYLTLNECDWSLVSKILPHFKNLEKLIIIGHQKQEPLDAEKAEIIDNVCTLLDNRTLTELIIWGAGIEDDNAKKIFDRITNDNPLCILDLSWNDVTEKDTQYVSDFIRKNKSLGILDLRGNEIEDAGAFKILEAKDYTPSEGTKVVLLKNPIQGTSLRNYFGLGNVDELKVPEDTERESSSAEEEDYFADTETAIKNPED